jgi:hypothetical protein
MRCVLAVLLMSTSFAFAQRPTVEELQSLSVADFETSMTSAAGERALFAEEMAGLHEKIANPTEKLRGIFWTAALFNREKDTVRGPLFELLPSIAQQPPQVQSSYLTGAHALFPTDAAPVLRGVLPALTAPREFAIAAYTILAADDTEPTRTAIISTITDRFPDWAKEPRLIALEHRLRVDPREEIKQRPPLADLFANPPKPGVPVIYSLQRLNRKQMGLAVVLGPDGRFVRTPSGAFFNIPHLAMARTNLPGTITNGNTPQGVFVIRGAGTATNKWIGPTPYLHSMLPFEAETGAFALGDGSEPWTLPLYLGYLPPTWRDYIPMREAFLAGDAGRSEILLHGTTINPEYYRGETYYPGTPSAGCLVASEFWSKEDGQLVHSDQLFLVKAFISGGQDDGYLVVVNLDVEEAPVSLSNIVDAMVAAEALLAPKGS